MHTRFFAPGNHNQQRRPMAPPLITKSHLFQAIWTLSYTPCAQLSCLSVPPRVRNPDKLTIQVEFVSTIWPDKRPVPTSMISAFMLSLLCLALCPSTEDQSLLSPVRPVSQILIELFSNPLLAFTRTLTSQPKGLLRRSRLRRP